MQQPGLERESERQHAHRPPPDAVRIMRVDMVGLGHQPDARTIEEAAQEKHRLRQAGGLPPIPEREAESVGRGYRSEHGDQLGAAGEVVPVVAHQEQRGQSDQCGRRSHQHEDRTRPAPLRHLARTLVQLGDALGLSVGDDCVTPPEAQLLLQPRSLRCGQSSLRHTGARTRLGMWGDAILSAHVL
jgi:hypothetical protein